MKKLALVALLMFVVGATSPCVRAQETKGPKVIIGEHIILDHEVYDTDTQIFAVRLEFKKGARIGVTNGATVSFISSLLVTHGPIAIDGAGRPGTNGPDGSPCNKPEWRSSGGNGWIGQHEIAHRDWEASGSDVDRGNNGGDASNGGPGARVLFQYDAFQAIGVNLPLGTLLSANVQGGNPGRGGRGSAGRVLRCGLCDARKNGPSGSNGSDGQRGADGSVTIVGPTD